MRDEILNGIKALTLGTMTVSDNLPWDESGTPLYTKNLKTFYVDEADETETSALATLDGLDFGNRVTTVRVFIAVDAKQKPTNFNTVSNSIRNLRNLTTITGVTARECDITGSFEGDTLIREFEFRFTEFLA
jgi:hypothetical protein